MIRDLSSLCERVYDSIVDARVVASEESIQQFIEHMFDDDCINEHCKTCYGTGKWHEHHPYQMGTAVETLACECIINTAYEVATLVYNKLSEDGWYECTRVSRRERVVILEKGVYVETVILNDPNCGLHYVDTKTAIALYGAACDGDRYFVSYEEFTECARKTMAWPYYGCTDVRLNPNVPYLLHSGCPGELLHGKYYGSKVVILKMNNPYIRRTCEHEAYVLPA